MEKMVEEKPMNISGLLASDSMLLATYLDDGNFASGRISLPNSNLS